jgi:tetratricopeptide (TPR) repeat protein
MIPTPLRFAVILALVSLTGSGCASVLCPGDPTVCPQEVARLQAELMEKPNDAVTHRELGEVYVHLERYGDAIEHLHRAFGRLSDDPETLFYLGLGIEGLGDRETALQYYEQYAAFPRSSTYRMLMLGRYKILTRQIAQEELSDLVANEATFPVDSLSDETVAVFALNYLGGDDTYAPLGRGLAEMIMIDLGQVSSLTVVERIRLQTLLDELALSESERIDSTTAPRVGHLLRAGRAVGGSYNVLDASQLRADMAIWNAGNAILMSPEASEGALKRLFQLEKEIVLNVLNSMGIQLTPQELERIDETPTKNLRAFIAFSRGLLEEDRANYAAARDHFAEALRLDPGFSTAMTHFEGVQSVLMASGSIQEVGDLAADLGPLLPPASLRVDGMLGDLGVDVNAVSGSQERGDTRDPAQEAVPSGSVGLPDPPRPPSGVN